MKGLWIFPTLVAILVIAIYFETKFLIIGLLILAVRILVLRKRHLNLVVILLAAIFLIRCQLIQQSIPKAPEFKVATISPDSISVNGDNLSGELKTKTQFVRFNYRIKTETEQHFWKNLSEIIQVKVTTSEIVKISGPRNIGEFNFQKYATHENVYYMAKIEKISQPTLFQPQTLFERINVLRIHIINYFKPLPKWLRVHAQSLIVGYTEYDDKDFLKILSTLGIIHLFSLSGLHVLIILTILRKLTSWLKIPLEWVNTVMLVLLPCYGLLVGSKSGIWRAIVLAMVGIICQKLRLNLSRLDIFSLTMLLCLFIYPFAVIEMGGQLSFLLAFAILYLYKPTRFLLMTFKMNLVSLPIICLYTYQFNYLTLLTNIIFVPFFTYFILPVTLISALSVKWSFWQLINSFYAELYKNLDAIANNLDFIFITGSLPIWSVIILSIIGIFYVESRGFANKFLGQYLIIFVSCIVFNKFPLFGSVNLIDVGQGDSIMVTTPLNRQTFLIDVAGKLSYPTKPWAKRTVHDQVDNSTLPFLKSQGISHIDKIFLSHKDVDHVGNLETILTKFKVKEVNFGIGLENNPRIKSAIKRHPQVKFKNLRQEDAFQTGPIKWQVLWPQKFSIGENGDSLTLLAQIKQKKWLFPGDLDIAGEKAIVKDHQFKVDYLKVGHHGSRTATSEKLLDVIQPKFGFISAGINNRYGHPNKETLERLQRHGVRYLNTADYGMISWYYYFFNDEEKITTFLKGDLLENNGIKK